MTAANASTPSVATARPETEHRPVGVKPRSGSISAAKPIGNQREAISAVDERERPRRYRRRPGESTAGAIANDDRSKPIARKVGRSSSRTETDLPECLRDEHQARDGDRGAEQQECSALDIEGGIDAPLDGVQIVDGRAGRHDLVDVAPESRMSRAPFRRRTIAFSTRRVPAPGPSRNAGDTMTMPGTKRYSSTWRTTPTTWSFTSGPFGATLLVSSWVAPYGR